MHFREPGISAKPTFLALTHVLVYCYWCCQVTILSAYNASIMFLLRYYQSIAMLSQDGISMYHLDFCHANIHGNKETNRKSFDVKCNNI